MTKSHKKTAQGQFLLFMRTSQATINKNLQKEILGFLFQLIADLKKPEEAKVFLEDILSKTEIETVAKRLAIAHYLDHDRSYQNIKNNLKVSSATIASVEKLKKSKGYQMALRKIEADHWASEWAEKIEKIFKR